MENKINSEFRTLIKRVLKVFKLEVGELAKMLDVSEATLVRWRDGITEPHQDIKNVYVDVLKKELCNKGLCVSMSQARRIVYMLEK